MYMLSTQRRRPSTRTILSSAVASALVGIGVIAYAQDPVVPPGNPHARQDMDTIDHRGDVVHLPDALEDRLEELAGRPHSQLPTQAYAEAHDAKGKPVPSRLFQYYLLDGKNFEPNPFTHLFKGINDEAMLTATGANHNLPQIGSVRVVLEPKPGLPTDPNDVRAFIDVFTDVSSLFVINNESGWYEGWMIWDIHVVRTNNTPRADGHAQFGTILQKDADRLKSMGDGNDVFPHVFTTDGHAPHLPSAADHFPDKQTNVVPLQVSMGAWNTLQQSDGHAYWEFNYTTNWVHPLYELPFTGGLPGTFEAGKVAAFSSVVPGSGPNGIKNDPVKYGDNPNTRGVIQASGPRDPDKFDAESDNQREFRMRFIPSGLATEVLLDVYERPASFEPTVTDLKQRLFDAYKAEVARVDANHDGVISAEEGDVDSASDGFADNTRLFIPATWFNRFAVTREINDGLLAPRFAPSQRAWVLSGSQVKVNPPVQGSVEEDADDR